MSIVRDRQLKKSKKGKKGKKYGNGKSKPDHNKYARLIIIEDPDEPCVPGRLEDIMKHYTSYDEPCYTPVCRLAFQVKMIKMHFHVK